MKWIMAIIQPHRLDAVRDALGTIGVTGMTVTEVRGFGRQRGQTEIYRGAEYAIHYIPKLKVEIAVGDALADRAIDTIARAGHTGQIGDGKIFSFPLDSAMRIRTGETGDDAL